MDITLEQGAQIRFAHASFSPADAGSDYSVGSPTAVAITLNALANATGRQSAKADLGANRAERYSVDAAFDFTGETPTQGAQVDLYWAPSTSSTAANGNPCSISGADAAAPTGALGSATLADLIATCIPIGSLVVHDGAAVQNGHVGVFSPPTQYGCLIVVNNSGDVFEVTDTEMAVWFTPIRGDVAAS